MFNFGRVLLVTLVLCLGLLLASNSVLAQEHPREHPQEHPKEHPSAAKKIDKESLAKAIEDYVAQDAALHGGFFMFFDKEENEALALTLLKVHKDRLSRISDDVYFACCDFKATNGHVYDLDIFMKGTSPQEFVPTEVTLHKKDGKARYNWYEEGGVWKRK